MTRLEADAGGARAATEPEQSGPAACDGPRAHLLDARAVPLGGVRAMEVHRSLPQRDLPMVGAWCFLDRFGPQSTTMRVEPHPHIGLQTVTWPLEGEVRHRDTVGSDVVVRRGALNLMTSGAGIAHSEYSVGDGPIPLDALQLWVALPEARRHGLPAFEQHVDLPVVALPGDDPRGAEATVVLGSFGGAQSPASVFTPIAGAEVRLSAGARVRLPLTPAWEYAIVGVIGEIEVEPGGAVPGGDPGAAAIELGPQRLLYLGIHRDGIAVRALTDATVFVLGGEPFEDDIVMWWNFVARSHEEIVEARDAWEAEAPGSEGADAAGADAASASGDGARRRFGHVVGHGGERIPAPPLPGVRLTRRRRRV